ncbi:hypothetical protein A0H81_03134 [Grifola frondosa]|uniref:DEAD-box RNA helicase Q domain-containing protein n=1 Tax=Grifola frondosa TaxID=5627 RepID=A0A1C7MQ01_GRIFR|nr:hypothetical protein A0H81_03134 [Grifola frondosa]
MRASSSWNRLRPLNQPNTMSQAGPSRPRRDVKAKKGTTKSKKVKKISEAKAIENLEQAALQFDPPPGLKAFKDLPISDHTKRGLRKAFFVDMTDIQAKSLPSQSKAKTY